MSDAGKYLVKDGAWVVPIEDRPTGWQSMPVGEITLTESETTATTRTREIHIKTPMASNPTTAAGRSFIPERTAAHERLESLVVAMFQFSAPLSDDDEVHEAAWEDNILSDATDEVALHNDAKRRTDSILNAWVGRNTSQLRHVGVGSRAIRDLWWVVYGLQKEFVRALMDIEKGKQPVRRCIVNWQEVPVACTGCGHRSQITHRPCGSEGTTCPCCCGTCNPKSDVEAVQ